MSYQQKVSRAGTSNYTPRYRRDVISCPWHWYRCLANLLIMKRHTCIFGGKQLFAPVGFRTKATIWKHVDEIYVEIRMSLSYNHIQHTWHMQNLQVCPQDNEVMTQWPGVESKFSDFPYWIVKRWNGFCMGRQGRQKYPSYACGATDSRLDTCISGCSDIICDIYRPK